MSAVVIIAVVVASVSDANALCRRDGGYYTNKVIGITRVVNEGLAHIPNKPSPRAPFWLSVNGPGDTITGLGG